MLSIVSSSKLLLIHSYLIFDHHHGRLPNVYLFANFAKLGHYKCILGLGVKEEHGGKDGQSGKEMHGGNRDGRIVGRGSHSSVALDKGRGTHSQQVSFLSDLVEFRDFLPASEDALLANPQEAAMVVEVHSVET